MEKIRNKEEYEAISKWILLSTFGQQSTCPFVTLEPSAVKRCQKCHDYYFSLSTLGCPCGKLGRTEVHKQALEQLRIYEENN